METREKILNAALQLILARGYPATTVDEMCATAGVSKGSFYHFFKSKEEMGLAVLEHYLAVTRDVLRRDAKAPGEDPIAELFDQLLWIERRAIDAWGGGCLLGTFALDLGEVNPRIQAKVESLFGRILADYTTLFEDAFRKAGVEELSPEAVAREYVTIVEGGIILSKAYGEPRKLVTALEDFRTGLRERLVLRGVRSTHLDSA